MYKLLLDFSPLTFGTDKEATRKIARAVYESAKALLETKRGSEFKEIAKALAADVCPVCDGAGQLGASEVISCPCCFGTGWRDGNVPVFTEEQTKDFCIKVLGIVPSGSVPSFLPEDIEAAVDLMAKITTSVGEWEAKRFREIEAGGDGPQDRFERKNIITDYGSKVRNACGEVAHYLIAHLSEFAERDIK